MKNRLILCCLCLTALNCFSQEKPVQGIIFDKESKERIASVNVRNLTVKASVYNNLKAEFCIKAKPGDTLVFTRDDYRSDTVKVKNNGALAVYMSRKAIQLKEVSVRDSVMTPEKKLAQLKRDFSVLYNGPLADNSFLSSPSYGGAGISIDAIYNALSRSGRNAAHLRQLIEQDYEQDVIDYRFNRTFVGNVTGLKDERLTAFMYRYRPSYYTTKTMTDYDFITLIKLNLRHFLHNHRLYAPSAYLPSPQNSVAP